MQARGEPKVERQIGEESWFLWEIHSVVLMEIITQTKYYD